jgi:hypothetical protein
VRIPADVDREDRLLAGLSARQLAILVPAALVLWMLYVGTRPFLPLPVFGACTAPVAATAAVLALGRRDGLSADRLVLAAVGQLRRPRRLVPAPDGITPPPRWLARRAGRLPAPLELPVRGIDPRGVVDLGAEGAALVCTASSLTFGLRSAAEQEALVGAFARFLNALTSPVQIVVRAERPDLRQAIVAIEEGAGALPPPALEAAAREHASFLAGLAASADVLHRQVLLVLREPKPAAESADILLRRAEEAASSLAAAGIALRTLAGEEAAAVLARATDAAASSCPGPRAAADDVVTAKAPR